MNTERQLDIDMQAEPEFMALLADTDFAVNAYCMFVNRQWHHADGDRWAVSWRSAGGIVADWRGAGESYVDFYMSDFFSPAAVDVKVQERIASMFAAVGWTEVTPEVEVAFHDRGMAAVSRMERLPAGESPETAGWYALFSGGDKWPEDDPRSRVHALAKRGLIGQGDFLRLLRDVSGLSREAAEIINARKGR